MECPKCQTANIKKGVPVAGRANVCQECGWFEVTSVNLEAGMTTYERRMQADLQKQGHPPHTEPSLHTCFMCGKSRTQLESGSIRLILGVNGGICARCVQLCQEVIEKESTNKA